MGAGAFLVEDLGGRGGLFPRDDVPRIGDPMVGTPVFSIIWISTSASLASLRSAWAELPIAPCSSLLEQSKSMAAAVFNTTRVLDVVVVEAAQLSDLLNNC